MNADDANRRSGTQEGPESLRVEADEQRPGVLLVRLTGWLDLATAPTLETALHDLLDARPSLVVVLDLGRTEFLGSAGIAVLLRLRRRTLARGLGPPRLLGLEGCARRTLETLGLLDQFVTVADLDSVSPALDGHAEAGS